MKNILYRSVLVFAATVVAACSQSHLEKPLVPRDYQWVANLTDQPKGHVDRICVESSLNTGFAILDFVDAKFTDSVIESKLMQGARQDYIRAMRKRDAEVWSKTHSVAALSQDHLIACLQEGGHLVGSGTLLERCFYETEPQAVFLLAMRDGRTLPASIDLVKRRYNDLDRGNDIANMGGKVFKAALNDQVLEDRMQAFSGCLRSAR